MTELEEIYKTYFKDIFLYIKGLSGDESIAEEIADETFFKAMKGLDGFKGNCDIRVWLCQIAKNSYYSHIRKQRKIADYVDAETIADSWDMAQKLEDKESSLRIHEIIHGLGEPYKEVFMLRLFGELSFSQIANVFDKSENWACVTYYRAKRKIQMQMEDI
ncbi:MAG: sigma-70 family RNA polymerase sigma factor [Clostridia bacterium]